MDHEKPHGVGIKVEVKTVTIRMLQMLINPSKIIPRNNPCERGEPKPTMFGPADSYLLEVSKA